MSYFGDIKRGIKTTAQGMRLTLKHLLQARVSRAAKDIRKEGYFEMDKGTVTIQYPHQCIPVPDNGRYQLDCEIDDCIVCDKCAKVCPVNCIDIEAIRSSEVIRNTSDGSPVRLYAARFDIDMAKCCFCGLCTTVCPTECLTMNSEYDYSVIDIRDLNFAFSNLTEGEANEKRELYEQFVAEKETMKKELEETKPVPKATKPVFAPKKPTAKVESGEDRPKPVFKPSQKPQQKNANDVGSKPVFKPSLKPKATPNAGGGPKEEGDGADPKPVFKPSLKPKAAPNVGGGPKEEGGGAGPKPVFKPSLKPKADPDAGGGSKEEGGGAGPKPVFKPSLKPKVDPDAEVKSKEEGEGKPKAKFKPTLKPKKK